MDRLLNYTFSLILIYIFALWAPASIHGVMIIGVIASLLFCSIAFIFGWLSLDGASAATVIGTTAFGFGGWPTVTVVICFFLSSTVISIKDKPERDVEIMDNTRRDGVQVWANGFWLVIWLLAGIFTNLFVCWIAAITVIATATADTWATELGSRRFSANTYLATTFRKVPAGTEGGVSWPGIAAALAGSLFIAMVATFGLSLSALWFICIAVAGFVGSFLDSILGATFQNDGQLLKIPGFRGTKEVRLNNNAVNWMATGLGSFILLILNQVFL